MNDCQALYPDTYSDNEDQENEEDEEEEEETNEYYTEDNLDDVQLSERGQQIFDRININSNIGKI